VFFKKIPPKIPLESIKLSPIRVPFSATIPLVASKSESNRALIINALAGGSPENLQNLSAARDTQTMLRLLASDEVVADVLDAGTTMRFLTAYFAITGQHKQMTGTARMCERPIGILTDALQELGAKIEPLRKEGYPPLQLTGFEYLGNPRIAVRGDVSSQFISALLMVAPHLPEGLQLQLLGEVGSRPYIEMTLAQMSEFGVEAQVDWAEKTIFIAPQKYQAVPYRVESDWSGASYWYAAVALSPFEESNLHLLGLKPQSLQGDSVLVELMPLLGVASDFDGEGVYLRKVPAQTALSWDFSHCPDIAQTIAVICAAKGIQLTLRGIESLKVKETDRIAALQQELAKIGATLTEIKTNDTYLLTPASQYQSPSEPIDTYDDHRMAMAFAPLAILGDIEIKDPEVVRKSYPSFWEDFARIQGT
jgi:3-phosphoshikimate 1-carboxyvinyltransferase